MASKYLKKSILLIKFHFVVLARKENNCQVAGDLPSAPSDSDVSWLEDDIASLFCTQLYSVDVAPSRFSSFFSGEYAFCILVRKCLITSIEVPDGGNSPL